MKKILRNCSGFTLMEISAVLAVMLIMTLAAMPTFSNYSQNQALKNSAKELIGDLKLMQQYTVTQQIKHSVQLTLNGNGYTMIKKNSPDETILNKQMSEDIIFYQITDLVDNEVVFNPTAAVDYSGEIVLKNNNNNEQINISIKPSGFITWSKVTP